MCTCFCVGPPVAPSVCSDWAVMGAMGIECEGEVLGVLDSGMDAVFSSTSSEDQKVGEEEEGGEKKGTYVRTMYIAREKEEGEGGRVVDDCWREK